MNNAEIVKTMLSISKRVKPYIYVKGQLDTLYDVEIAYVKEEDVAVHMKKAIDSLAIKIKLAKGKIFNLYTKMNGYKPGFFNIDYISINDIENGVIPVDNNDTYLRLSDGEFVVATTDIERETIR